jgi:serine kinase of HPr protein (carbohydrate metabolism regulator)
LSDEADRVHATAIAVGGRGVLIRGPSGSGKSDLALRCLALSPSALLKESVELVADDQVLLKADKSASSPRLIATCPPTLRGKLEVRGVGILEIAARDKADIVLVADLVPKDRVDRFPDPWPKVVVLGFKIPTIRIFPFETSASLKLVGALAMADLPRIEPKA